jgi:hypothetical protein
VLRDVTSDRVEAGSKSHIGCKLFVACFDREKKKHPMKPRAPTPRPAKVENAGLTRRLPAASRRPRANARAFGRARLASPTCSRPTPAYGF